MDGTAGFLSLDDKVKKCQSTESVLECEANAYLDSGRKKCGCVPHHLMSFSTTVSQITGSKAGLELSRPGD